MPRNRILVLALAPFIALTACKKDAAVQETIDLLDKHGKEITSKVTSASDKKAGVADAQKYIDSNKDDIAKRIKEMGELKGFQVSEEMQSKMASSLVDAAFMCSKIQVDLMAATMEDKDLDDALNKLCKTWDDAVKI
ncbi:MAG: hypothetical protein K1X88_07750 [Nannocystaceae bacterium]|nr:hypothetical protein [Nannocystaceae bacterium]